MTITRRGVLSALPMAIAGGAVVAVAANPASMADTIPHEDARAAVLQAFEEGDAAMRSFISFLIDWYRENPNAPYAEMEAAADGAAMRRGWRIAHG